VIDRCDHDAHCITCGDDAVPLRVVRIDETRELALCENDAGERTTVEIALVQPVSLDDVVLVHAGTAIARAAA
jgi:hydrogenase maturation factor